MRFGIVSGDPNEFEARQLRAYAEARSHAVTHFCLDDVEFRPAMHGIDAVARGTRLADLDVIVSRVAFRQQNWKNDLEKFYMISASSVPVMDPAEVLIPIRTKSTATCVLGAAGLPVAPTRICESLDAVFEQCKEWGDVVVKPSYGYGGVGVERLLEDDLSALGAVRALLAEHGVLLCQPYLPHAHDLRVVVVGGQVAYALTRTPQPGKWKTNVSQGAVSLECEPPPEAAEIAVAIANVTRLSMFGVDLMPHRDGWLVIEVNPMFGWRARSEQCQQLAMARILAHAGRLADGLF